MGNWFKLYRQRVSGGYWDYHTKVPELGCHGGFAIHPGSYSEGCITVTIEYLYKVTSFAALFPWPPHSCSGPYATGRLPQHSLMPLRGEGEGRRGKGGRASEGEGGSQTELEVILIISFCAFWGSAFEIQIPFHVCALPTCCLHVGL